MSLIASKARVAPLKPVIIPRLELQAACGAAKLAQKVESELEIKEIQQHYYTDSTVVLGYINNELMKFQTYVENCVENICGCCGWHCDFRRPEK